MPSRAPRPSATADTRRSMVERKAALAELAKQLDELGKQLTAITEEQSRLRANLEKVPKESPNHQHDQARVASAADALAAGADLLVIGRAVTAASDRVAAAETLAASLA